VFCLKTLFGVFLYLCGMLAFAASEPADIIFSRAVQAMAAGNYATAEQGFQSVLRREPRNVGAIGNLGILYARTNRAGQAIAEYQAALRLSPDDESILLNLGIVYFKQELHALALPYFARVVKVDPRNQQAQQLLAVCQIYGGQVGPAIHTLESLSTANPKDEQVLFLLGFGYLKQGDSKTAESVFNRMLDVAGPARAQFLLGRASYEAALFPQAEESFLQVLRLDANFPGLHLELGKLYISERRTDDAIRELRAALRENPDNEDANYFLGSLLVRESRFEEGIRYLEAAKKLKPDSWAIYFYLGRAKLHEQQTAEAAALLEKAVALNPNDASAQYQFGRALQANGQKDAAAGAFARARDLKADALNDAAIPGVR
jgi:tetratricopeptide (TPR) repeat protein